MGDMNYFWNLLQAVNRLTNTLFGGTDKEYMSSRVYRYKDVNKVAYVTYRITTGEKDHCQNADEGHDEGKYEA